MKCNFNLAWIGKCGKPVHKNGVCEEHSETKCRVCKRQATRQCSIASSLVCGMPLCSQCKCPVRGH